MCLPNDITCNVRLDSGLRVHVYMKTRNLQNQTSMKCFEKCMLGAPSNTSQQQVQAINLTFGMREALAV